MTIDHLSPSQIDLYWTCGLAYKYIYVDRIKPAPSAAMVRGSVSHKLIEAKLKDKEANLWEEYNKILASPEMMEYKLNNTDKEELTKGISNIIPVIDKMEWYPNNKIELVEQTLDYYLDDIKIVVRPDIVDENMVYDHKIVTINSIFKYEKMNYPIQLIIGALATGKTMGAYNLFVEGKDKTFTFRRITYNFLPLRSVRVIEKIKSTYKMISNDIFFPVDKDGPTGWKCTPKFCDFYSTCKFGAQDKINPEQEEYLPF